ncbi:MAG: chromosome segregation protein SMC [Limnochordia bacterium]
MYLKSLVMQGFKSFASRVELSFLPGVAAVVGPNGSGKSNISDAIRWVLGEQSVRTLRGTRVQDIIFSGSDARRALGMAEVSMCLDNSSGLLPLDYSEVTITRRVFRSGDSQFAINKTPCRLRDIQEMLLDSGIGRGSLSLVGQGEVDAVLNAAPEQRRLLLEDAAGVTRYRTRKEEAIEKLSETAENLLRVDDLIAEITDRLEPLQEAAEKARYHLQLSTKVRELELALLYHDRRRLERSSLREAERHALLVAKKDSLSAEVHSVQERRVELEQKVNRDQDEMEITREKLQAAREREQQLTHSIELGMEKEHQAQRDLQRSAEALSKLKAQATLAQQQRTEATEALTRLRHAHDSQNAVLAAIEETRAESELEMHLLSEQLDQARQGLAESERIAALCEGELRSEKGSEEQSESQRRRLERERAAHEKRVADVAAERGQLNTRLTELNSALTQVQLTAETTEAGLREAAAARTKLEKRHSEQTRLLSEVESRFRVLESMADSYEGYFQGARSVLAARRELGEGILGSVADLIRVPAELDLAVETALGNSLQSIVTHSEQAAEAAIAFLKRTRSGRATFLPLDALRYRVLSTAERQALAHPEFIGVAADLISCNPSAKSAVDFLLGRTVFARTLQGALTLSKRVRGFQRIVSLEGDLVTPGGAITGGSQTRRGPGLLSRNRELDELREQLASLGQESTVLKERYAAAQDRVQTLESQVKEYASKRHALELDKASAAGDAAALEKEWQRLEVLGRQLTQEEHDSSRQDRERSERLARVHEQLTAANTARESSRAEMESISQRLTRAMRHRDEIQASLGEASLTAARTSHDKEAAAAKLGQWERALAEALQRIHDEEESIRVANQLLTQLEATMSQHRRQVEAAHAEHSAYLERLRELREHEKALQAELSVQTAAERELRDAGEAVQEQIQARAVSLARVQAAMATVEEKLAALGAEESDGFPPETSTWDVTEVRRELGQCHQQLEEMGSVNPTAPEEFAKVNERYAFLCNQRQDLVTARQHLEETIAEIDSTSTSRLMTTYRDVRQAFTELFRRLFGGGTADLVWLDESNPLDSGLELMAQPPGKAMQRLIALSGGERALTAIALIFAILAVRPSPFCVLDEVDAALDERNLGRFASLLVEFSAKTQFLVITHRQATMEVADTLYGVTMDRAATSNLVTLRLSSQQQEKAM